MSAACSELGLRYSAIDAPAATDAVAYARAMTGSWLRDKGPELSLFCSEPSLAAPLIAGAVAGGGIIADAAASATRAAYAVALGLDLGAAKGDAKRERALLEKAAKSLGLGGRLGLWNADFAEASVEGLAEFARREAAAPSSGAAKTDGLKALIAALDASSPEAAWLGAYDVDPSTGVKSANHVLLRQDVYVLGSGFLQSGLQSVPAKYLTMTGPAP